jgi:hypothetical protein
VPIINILNNKVNGIFKGGTKSDLNINKEAFNKRYPQNNTIVIHKIKNN